MAGFFTNLVNNEARGFNAIFGGGGSGGGGSRGGSQAGRMSIKIDGKRVPLTTDAVRKAQAERSATVSTRSTS